MGLTTAYRNLLNQATIGAAYTSYANANAYIGIGDSSTAFANSQTDLQAATNKLRKAMDATYPTAVTDTLTFKSTFGSSDANYVWNEWAIFNASSSGTMLSRKVESMGTKVSGSTWVITATVVTNV